MFYDRFVALCEKKGVSENKACEDCGFSRSLAAKWKNMKNNGKDVKPNSKTLKVFSDYFGVSADYLLTGIEPEPVVEDDVAEIREAMRDNDELKILFKLAKNAKTSDVLQASALLQKLREESENK